uniref:WGS project CBMI000000000 data, contig CS3069_c002065 n=1 Tax=Fusarium clavum TaxID=2594811 RepID=A0A090MCJ4_9HYPO|nr:unnamed protein product [Fusarium clavum]
MTDDNYPFGYMSSVLLYLALASVSAPHYSEIMESTSRVFHNYRDPRRATWRRNGMNLQCSIRCHLH